MTLYCMVRVTLRESDDFEAELEAILGYRGNKSEFYRKAARERLERARSGEITLTEEEVGEKSEADA